MSLARGGSEGGDARVRRGSAWMTDLSGGETIVELAFPLAGAFLFSHLGSRFLQARGKLISVFGDSWSKPEEGATSAARLAEGHPKHHVFRSHKVRFGVN